MIGRVACDRIASTISRRNRRRSLGGAAVFVVAPVGQRREEPLHQVVVVGVDLDGVDAGVDREGGRRSVLPHQPAHLVDVQRVGDAMVGVARQGGRRGDRHPALQDHLHREQTTTGMHPGGELADAVRIARIAEEARPVRAHAGGLETGRQRVAHEVRPAAEPAHAAGQLGQPQRGVLLELGCGTEEAAVAAAVGRHDQAMVEAERADLDRPEHVRISTLGALGRLGFDHRPPPEAVAHRRPRWTPLLHARAPAGGAQEGQDRVTRFEPGAPDRGGIVGPRPSRHGWHAAPPGRAHAGTTIARCHGAKGGPGLEGDRDGRRRGRGGDHTACPARRVAGREGQRAAHQPCARRTSWTEALSWAAASGVALAVTRLVAQRGAAAAWKAKTGSNPPGLEDVA